MSGQRFRALYPRSRRAYILFFCFILQSNRIGRLPKEMGALSRLKTLDVSNNELAELPAALGYLPELNRLAVEGNPLKSIRRSVISGPTSSFKVGNTAGVGFGCCTTRFSECCHGKRHLLVLPRSWRSHLTRSSALLVLVLLCVGIA